MDTTAGTLERYDPFSQNVALPEPFADVERRQIQVESTSYLTPQALIDVVSSRSYCITSPTDVRVRTPLP